MGTTLTGASLPAGSAASSKPNQPTNTLTLSASGGDFTGWQQIRVTRRLEGCPNDFEVNFTDRATDGRPAEFQVKPGDACTVKLGSTVVVSGYIDRVAISVTPASHSIRVMGRGKCQDLVDCSMPSDQLHGMEITTSSLLDLANKLMINGIKVVDLTGTGAPISFAGGAPVSFNAVLTETSFEIIERVARYAGVLVYENADGNLVLANVGTGQHASGVAQGYNMQEASTTFSVDERYSKYFPVLMSVNALGDQNVGGKPFPAVLDSGITRDRLLIIVSEQFQLDQSMAEKRANWEMHRRKGRSQAVRVVCDNWRDKAGVLWEPNFYCPIDIPSVRANTSSGPWIIAEATFSISPDRGTTADLVLLPKDAFLPEPIILRPDPWNPTDPGPGSGGAALNPPT